MVEIPRPLNDFTDRMEALRASNAALVAWQASGRTAGEVIMLLEALRSDVRHVRESVPALREIAAGISVTEGALGDVDSRLQATELMVDQFLDLASRAKSKPAFPRGSASTSPTSSARRRAQNEARPPVCIRQGDPTRGRLRGIIAGLT